MNRFIFSIICFLLLYGNVVSTAFGSPKIFGVNVFLFSVILILILNVWKYLISPTLVFTLSLFSIILFLKYFVDNFEFSSTIIKLTYSLFTYVLFYIYIRTIDLKDSFYLNYFFFLLIITSLISFAYPHLFPNLAVATDKFNEPIGFVFIDHDNGYTRDGLFGANILSYILVLGFVLVVRVNRTSALSFYLRMIYFFSSWLAIITMHSYNC